MRVISAMQVSARTVQHIVLRFVALTVLFTLLNYVGMTLYGRAEGTTTIKPYIGVALALILICGRSWRWPVIACGLFGAFIAKTFLHASLLESIRTPCMSTGVLLATDYLCQKLIGREIDFRAWQQLVRFIVLVICVGAASGFAYAFGLSLWKPLQLWSDWRAWCVPTSLSYVVFTPVMVLLATADKAALRGNWRPLAAGLAVLAAALAANYVSLDLPLLFLVPLALLLMTMICGIEGTALGLGVTELVVTVATVCGWALSGLGHLSLGYQLYFVQIFLSVMIAVMLPAAAAITERGKLRDAMRAALLREERVNKALRDSESHALAMVAEAQRANCAKSEFLASMSHELRTPLNAILGFSEIIKTQLYGPLGHEKYVEYSEDVHKSGAHLLDLINDVLDLSKIDAGRMELRESLFPVRELMDDAVMLLREKAKDHVNLELCLCPPLQLAADRRLTKQILINLLSNAIKFTPKGGAITVGALEKPGQGIEIYVADTGIGMTEAQIEKAFSPYGQVDSRIARTHKGTGLGLPISQSLARLHGGDLLAQSIPGKGTRMTLVLPESRVVRTSQALFSVG